MKLNDLAKVLITTKPIVVTSFSVFGLYHETSRVELLSKLEFEELLKREVDYFVPRDDRVVIYVK